MPADLDDSVLPAPGDDLDRELTAFGRSLAARVGGPIEPDLPGSRRASSRRRSWPWVLGAAAALVVLVVGLVSVVGRDEPSDAPVATDVLPEVDDEAALTTTVPPPTTAVFVDDLRPLPDIVGDDPLDLVAQGWTVEPRRDEPWRIDGDLPSCPAFDTLAGYGGVATSVITYRDPATGLDVGVTFLAAPTDADAAMLRDAFGSIDDCGLGGTGELVRLDQPDGAGPASTTVRGFVLEQVEAFSIVALSANGNLVVAIEVENTEFDAATVEGLVDLVGPIVASTPWVDTVGAADGAAETTLPVDPEVTGSGN